MGTFSTGTTGVSKSVRSVTSSDGVHRVPADRVAATDEQQLLAIVRLRA